MRYFILAGEPSGDMHAANLARELLLSDPSAELHGWGGEKMQAAGVSTLTGLDELSFMGFWEIAKKLPHFYRLNKKVKEDILTIRPDVVILVDYPGFNLRLAKWLRRQGIPTAWYISPQLWAWKPGRVKTIRENVGLMMVILPFEEAFYAQHDIKAHYVGHPLMDVIPTTGHGQPAREEAIIALLPGSRKQEIERLLPVMLKTADILPQEKFVVAGLSAIRSIYEKLPFPANVSIRYDQAYKILSDAKAAVVTSGTATLETALFGVPQVVVYKGSRISYFVARRLVRVPFISLVNLIADKKVVTELIQGECTPENIQEQLTPLLSNTPEKTAMAVGYTTLYQLLGTAGASKNAAKLLVEFAGK